MELDEIFFIEWRAIYMMRGHYNPGMHGMHGYGYGYNIWFILLLIAVIVAIIVGVMLLMRYSRNEGSTSSVSSAPFDIIKERLAKGEIDEAEYEQLKEKLKEK